jgi:hypothetical protein
MREELWLVGGLIANSISATIFGLIEIFIDLLN